LLRLGDIDEYRNRYINSLRQQSKAPNWTGEVTQYVSEDQLKGGANVAASILPADLLTRIRQEKEGLAGLQMITDQQKAMEAAIEDYVLCAEVPKVDPAQVPNGGNKPAARVTTPISANFVVRTVDGQILGTLPEPRPAPPPQAPLVKPDSTPLTPNFRRQN